MLISFNSFYCLVISFASIISHGNTYAPVKFQRRSTSIVTTTIQGPSYHTLYGVVTSKMRNETYRLPLNDVVESLNLDDDASLHELFSSKETEVPFALMTPTDEEILQMKPNDPRFLDVPWPEKAGPIASAYAKHIQWKRNLSDGERKRWQKWAIYSRMNSKQNFEYSLEDYVFQKMLRDIDIKTENAIKNDVLSEATMWSLLSQQYKDTEITQVRATVKAFYHALNRQNIEDIKSLWLPDEAVDIILPGFRRETGYNNVESFFRNLLKASKPFCGIKPEVVKVTLHGFVAVVHSIETITEGYSLRSVKKKGNVLVSDSVKKSGPPRRVLSTTVLRKYNRQWRLMSHHAARFVTSPFTGDALDFSVDRKRQLRKDRSSDKASGVSSLPDNLRDALLDGNMMSVMRRLNDKGEWERVVVKNKGGEQEVDQDIRDREKRREREKLQMANAVELDEDKLIRARKSGVGLGLLGEIMARARGEEEEQEEEQETSISKRTVQAVRSLCKGGSITIEQKRVLLSEIIRRVSQDETSRVETAFELLVLRGGLDRPSRLKDRRSLDEQSVEAFAEYCVMMATQFQKDEDEENDD